LNGDCTRQVGETPASSRNVRHFERFTVAKARDALRLANREWQRARPESTIALCLNHSDGNRKSATRGYIKPSAEVRRARELAKIALKRDAFDRWAERLREIIA
jgi:hypothetical protein